MLIFILFTCCYTWLPMKGCLIDGGHKYAVWQKCSENAKAKNYCWRLLFAFTPSSIFVTCDALSSLFLNVLNLFVELRGIPGFEWGLKERIYVSKGIEKRTKFTKTIGDLTFWKILISNKIMTKKLVNCVLMSPPRQSFIISCY